MSKPQIEDYIDHNVVWYKKTGDLPDSIEEQKVFLKKLYPEDYTEEHFNEYTAKAYKEIDFPKPKQLGDEPALEMDVSEKEKFTKEYSEEIIPPTIEGMKYKPEEQYELKNEKDLFDLQKVLDEQTNRDLKKLKKYDEDTLRRSYEKNLTKMVGGEIPKTKDGVPIYDV